MKLARFLIAHQMTPAAFARLIGVTRNAVHRYVRGERMPAPEVMERIVQVTEGAVTPNDFYDIALDAGAVAEFPWSRTPQELDPFEGLERIMARHRVSRPVAYAMYVLGGRIRPIGPERFLIDGRQGDVRALIRRANDALAAQHRPLIAYPGVFDPDRDPQGRAAVRLTD